MRDVVLHCSGLREYCTEISQLFLVVLVAFRLVIQILEVIDAFIRAVALIAIEQGTKLALLSLVPDWALPRAISQMHGIQCLRRLREFPDPKRLLLLDLIDQSLE